MNQELLFTNHVAEAIDTLVEAVNPPTLFVLVDNNTKSFVLPRMQMMSKAIGSAEVITTYPGDDNKTLEALASIWKVLGERGATRRSMLVNLGGGMVTDMGAFAASTFKRGIDFINVPTTLLGAVDASVGGKTGINFNGLKNEIGLFNTARLVIISTMFFNTLPRTELRSGYAEMLKHGMIESPEVYHRLLGYRVEELDPERLLDLLRESVMVKSRIVSKDPTEQGLRRALNLGHTAGHAFESLAMERKSPIPHGYAVAYGLVVAAVLSHIKLGFPTDEVQKLAAYVRENYGAFAVDCDDYPELLRLMSHDKKNATTDAINFTLLRNIGDVVVDNAITPADVTAALDLYRDLLGLA